VPLCEHPWYGVAQCSQELHATISSVVVPRYTSLGSLLLSIALFSLDDEFESRFCIISPTHVHLSLNSTSPSTYPFNFLVFRSRVFSAPVDVLFLLEMYEPDGSKASDTFFNGAVLSRVM